VDVIADGNVSGFPDIWHFFDCNEMVGVLVDVPFFGFEKYLLGVI
jgi:hypothetical protein